MYFDILDDLPPDNYKLDNNIQVLFYYLLLLWLFYFLSTPNVF